MAKEVWSVDRIIEQLDGDQIWNVSPGGGLGDTLPTPHGVITYSMTGIARDQPNSYNVALGITGMSQREVDMATTAFELWDDLIAPSLTPSDSPNAQITFNYTTDTSHNNPYTSTFPQSGTYITQSDI